MRTTLFVALLACLALGASYRPASPAVGTVTLAAPLPSAGVVETPPWSESVLRVETRIREKDAQGAYRTYKATASGVWTNHGVVTAWHVVADAQTVYVHDSKGRTVQAWGWWRQNGEDVAVVRLMSRLTVPALPLAEVPLALAAPVPAEAVAYWGIGEAMGLQSRSLGWIVPGIGTTKCAYDDLGKRFYGTTIPVVPGMSGGPLVVNGKVYGVVSHTTCPGTLAFFAYCDMTSCPLQVGAPPAGLAFPAPPQAPAAKPAPPPVAPPKAPPQKWGRGPAPCPPGGT